MDLDKELTELVKQLDGMVETVSTSPGLGEVEVRRALRFISQVIQVVEQAFQDVLTLLVEIKYLEEKDIHSDRLNILRKQVDLLTSRSYYRDAAEICSRLKHLRENFDETIWPSLSVLPELKGWQSVLGLIQEGEGRIIMLINATARELELRLGSLTPETLASVNAMATRNAEQLRSLLAELHDLNGRILGYSGKLGFLELTRDRNQLEQEIKIMVDKRDQSITHGHRVELGNNNSIGNLVVSNSIQDSFNQVNELAGNDKLKEALELLCTQVQELTKSLPPAKRTEIEQDLASLVAEGTKETPRPKWYELSASGLTEAAKACAGIASPVIATVKSVLALLAAAS
jgi:hypothetical protein